jgi:DNA-binding CsgD family transcriptional regulator
MSRPRLELGAAELRVAAPDTVGRLAEAAELIREPASVSIAARLLANALSMADDADGAVRALASAIEAVEPADRELALVLEADLAAHAQQARRETRAQAAARLERHGGLRGSTPAERLVLATLAFERARTSESAAEAAAHIEPALAGGRLLGEQDIDVVGTFYLLMVGLVATDAQELAAACWDQAFAEAKARASIPAMAFVLAKRSRVALRQGAVAHAEADARTAFELIGVHGIRLGYHLALGMLVEALIEVGDVEGADEMLCTHAPEEIPPGLATNPLLEARGRLRLAQGRTAEGTDDLTEFGRRDELWGGANPLASRWRSRLAPVLATLGDQEEARRLAADDLARARRWGAASGIGVALRAAALVDDGAVDGLREAVAVLAGSPARLEHARALTDLGAALRRANRWADARGVLHEALDGARRCGAHALADRARTELRAVGGRSAGRAVTGVEALTASERRVADLAAAGRSNPEIAQTLFVTRKTVETHLGAVYRKLGIRGRGHLARALADQSPASAG